MTSAQGLRKLSLQIDLLGAGVGIKFCEGGSMRSLYARERRSTRARSMTRAREPFKEWVRLEWSQETPGLSFQESYNFFTRVSEGLRAPSLPVSPNGLPGVDSADPARPPTARSSVPWSANCGCLATTW